jgi:NitT/TauT family transport system substrate-binding protein
MILGGIFLAPFSATSSGKWRTVMRKALVLPVIGLSLALASVSASAADQITYILDWLPNGKQTPAYVAIKEGYFRDAGLEVTIISSRGSSDAITKVMTGTADIGSGGLNALMMAAAESPVTVKAIYSIFSKQPDSTYTVKGSGITSLKDLAGRTVATAAFTSSNTIWPLIAEINGLDHTKVTLLKVEPASLAALLATGKVDAMTNWSNSAPVTEATLKAAGKEMVLLPWADFGLEGYSLSMFASDKMIKERPEVVARFVKAYEKAIRYSLANPDAAARALQAAVPQLNVELATAECRTTVPLIQNEISAKYGLGTFEPGLLKKTWEWVAKAQGYPMDKVDPDKLVDRSFIPRS